ncbi:hypothetical protein Tco_0513360 [Tanacetum coccineum]
MAQQILLDHPLSYALTATADVPVVYLQKFWRTVSKVSDTEDTINFILDIKEFTYTVDMFRVTLHLPVETSENLFVAPVNIQTIQAFINRVGYQGVVDKKKEAIQYPRFIKLIIADLMKKFPTIPQRVDEDYHSIKDDTPLVSVYTAGNVLVRGMLIPDAFLTKEICATDDFKEYETMVVKGKKRKQTAGESSSPRKSHKITIRKKKQSSTPIPPPGDDRERDEVAEAIILSLTLHKTALAAEAQENIAKVQEKLDEEEIEKMIKPRSHKEHPKIVNDDDQIEKEKHDEEIEKEKRDEKIVMEKDNDDIEKVDEGIKEKHNVDVATDNMDFRKEKMQTPITSPIRSPRKVSSSDKTVTKDLTDTVSPTTATTSKDSSTYKHKK